MGRGRAWIRSDESLLLLSRVPVDDGENDDDFREASVSDATRYARDIGTDSAESFSRRLAPDVRCFVIDDGDALVHASWVTTTGAFTREIGRHLCPPPGDAYIYESFTRAETRGRGLYPKALRGIVRWCARNGIARVWVGVEESNEASRRALAKGGFEVVFRLAYGRRLGRLTLRPPDDEGRSAAEELLRCGGRSGGVTR